MVVTHQNAAIRSSDHLGIIRRVTQSNGKTGRILTTDALHLIGF